MKTGAPVVPSRRCVAAVNHRGGGYAPLPIRVVPLHFSTFPPFHHSTFQPRRRRPCDMRGLFAIIHPFRPKGRGDRLPARERRACRDRIPRLGLRCVKALKTITKRRIEKDTALRAVSHPSLYLLRFIRGTSRDASEEVSWFPHRIRNLVGRFRRDRTPARASASRMSFWDMPPSVGMAPRVVRHRGKDAILKTKPKERR